MDKMDYHLKVMDRPGLTLSPEEVAQLQSKLCKFGSLTFSPLPNYQVFETSSKTALNDKIIAIATKGDDIVGFLSVVVLPIPGMKDPVFHTGLTVVHPDHRQSGMKINLFGAVFAHVLTLHPKGVWLSSLSRILTSLGQIATYTNDVFPSPEWDRKHPSGKPTDTHLRIAREIAEKHRDEMLVPPGAHFDEQGFVFRTPDYRFSGPGTIDGVNDPKYRHRNAELADFYTNLLQESGDEILQISYLDPVYTMHFQRERNKMAQVCYPTERKTLKVKSSTKSNIILTDPSFSGTKWGTLVRSPVWPERPWVMSRSS